ncbi:hypothetical protein DFH06DRAFT_1474544 [Mycena polygramma]|nr:hypothetical protein DFH06DRAFT_1474544 [Mycena polygramma]
MAGQADDKPPVSLCVRKKRLDDVETHAHQGATNVCPFLSFGLKSVAHVPVDEMRARAQTVHRASPPTRPAALVGLMRTVKQLSRPAYLLDRERRLCVHGPYLRTSKRGIGAGPPRTDVRPMHTGSRKSHFPLACTPAAPAHDPVTLRGRGAYRQPRRRARRRLWSAAFVGAGARGRQSTAKALALASSTKPAAVPTSPSAPKPSTRASPTFTHAASVSAHKTKCGLCVDGDKRRVLMPARLLHARRLCLRAQRECLSLAGDVRGALAADTSTHPASALPYNERLNLADEVQNKLCVTLSARTPRPAPPHKPRVALHGHHAPARPTASAASSPTCKPSYADRNGGHGRQTAGLLLRHLTSASKPTTSAPSSVMCKPSHTNEIRLPRKTDGAHSISSMQCMHTSSTTKPKPTPTTSASPWPNGEDVKDAPRLVLPAALADTASTHSSMHAASSETAPKPATSVLPKWCKTIHESSPACTHAASALKSTSTPITSGGV